MSETTPPEMGAGTKKQRSDKPAENNRPYAAERVSHTAASRETVLTVSAPTGFKSRLFFRDTLKPVYKIKERTDVMNEAKNKNLFIRVSEKEKNIIEQKAKSAGFPYRNISASVLWDICREPSCPKYSSLLTISWMNSASLSKAKLQRIRKKK